MTLPCVALLCIFWPVPFGTWCWPAPEQYWETTDGLVRLVLVTSACQDELSSLLHGVERWHILSTGCSSQYVQFAAVLPSDSDARAEASVCYLTQSCRPSSSSSSQSSVASAAAPFHLIPCARAISMHDKMPFRCQTMKITEEPKPYNQLLSSSTRSS